MADKKKSEKKDKSAERDKVPQELIMQSELKDMVSAMMNDMRTEILESVKNSVQDVVEQQWNDYSQNYHEDELCEDLNPCDNADMNVMIQEFTSQSHDQTTGNEVSSCLDSLASEFSTNQLTGQPIAEKLAAIVNNLINDTLSKEQLVMKDKYLKPANCEFLLTPKINKMVWSQLKQEIKNADSSLQKAQDFHMSSLYALLKVCHDLAADSAEKNKEHLTTLTHAVVLALSANRQMNLSRRDLLRPHLNKQYQALCNPSVPITTLLLGDDLNKEIEDLSKANRISYKIQGNTAGRGQRFRPYGFHRGRGARGNSNSFRGRGRGVRNSFRSFKQPFLLSGRGYPPSQT